MKTPVALLILDGWGHREAAAYNAPALASTPVFDRLWAECPTALLAASGAEVGLPIGQIGNSEVGHLNIGAGRVVMQTLPRIDAALNTLETLPAFKTVVAKAQAGSGRIHLMGLMSPGGVHSHQRHGAALANALHATGLEVILHLFTDGRDTAPAIAAQCLAEFQSALASSLKIATISGRYYAMDRDERWERTTLVRDLIAYGGLQKLDAKSLLISADKDEFVEPTLVADYAGIQPGDALACFNFRADRVRQLLRALLIPGTPGYADLGLSACLAMAPYARDLDGVAEVLFDKENLNDTLAETVSKAGKTQLHLAETEKYPHVTFFFNGGREVAFKGEERFVAASPKVATYDLAPEMSAAEVSAALDQATTSGAYDLIVCNFANPDMVGHTGDLAAAKAACACVDQALGSFLQALQVVGGTALITADHGNAEIMWDTEQNAPHTAHTLSPVPLIHVGPQAGMLKNGKLADLAPTILSFMGLQQPAAMTGQCLWQDV